MSLRAEVKRVSRLLLPPIVTDGLRRVRCGRVSVKPVLEYAPLGWRTVLNNTRTTGWNAASVVAGEKSRYDAFVHDCQGSGPLGFSHEHTDLSEVRNVSFHNIHISYAYVLALAARQKSTLSVLDWGGGLGHYYLIGKAVVPDVTLDFHCKEVPLMAEAGKQFNPDVQWYADESCLERAYDLVMINGSLQYMPDWAEALRRIAPAVKEYLLLTRVPVVENGPGFVAIQRHSGVEMLHQQLNQAALLRVVEQTGLHLVRELVVGDRPGIENAPEQCELRGWLFKKDVIDEDLSDL
jgi:putative methyltransferase (TIGR04325 family)